MLQAGEVVSEQHLLDCPQPRVKLGQALAGHANACIDVSDGLLADIKHVLEASACGARIELASLPAAENLSSLDQESRWKHQLSGGDDYELLFTLPSEKQTMLASWREQLDINLSIIGEIEGESGIRCVRPDGTVYQSRNSGFEHFGQKP